MSPPIKPTDAQRALFNKQFDRDATGLLKDIGLAVYDHLAKNPDSVITQTIVSVEKQTGAFTVLTRAIQQIVRERDAKKVDDGAGEKR